jgi:hypothetical protein
VSICGFMDSHTRMTIGVSERDLLQKLLGDKAAKLFHTKLFLRCPSAMAVDSNEV